MRRFNFYIKNFGCKVNQYDGQLLGKSVLLFGEKVSTPSRADIVIVNTCGVTNSALAGGCKYVRKIKKKYPAKEVLAVGCAAGEHKEKFISEGADTAAHFKMFIPPGGKLDKFRGHTRGFLKIQQGCHGSCLYCAVRKLKRPFYVKPPIRVADEIRKMSQNHPEIVLCGTNLGFYRSPAPNGNLLLAELIKRIKELPPVFRWRFSSIPPVCLSDRNLKILKEDEKFCRHFHIPVQSASARILKKMKRPYSLKYLEDRIKKARKILKDPVFSYDIMVGFPGESQDDFNNTIDFLKKYPPVRVHVFRYSHVKDTPPPSDRVRETVKRERMEKVKEVSGDLIHLRLQKEIGRVREVVVEKNSTGYTRQYIPVKFTEKPHSCGELRVLITAVSGDKLLGREQQGAI